MSKEEWSGPKPEEGVKYTTRYWYAQGYDPSSSGYGGTLNIGFHNYSEDIGVI